MLWLRRVNFFFLLWCHFFCFLDYFFCVKDSLCVVCAAFSLFLCLFFSNQHKNKKKSWSALIVLIILWDATVVVFMNVSRREFVRSRKITLMKFLGFFFIFVVFFFMHDILFLDFVCYMNVRYVSVYYFRECLQNGSKCYWWRCERSL